MGANRPVASSARCARQSRLPRWLQADDDSLLAWVSHGARRPASAWFPIVNLVWLGWVVAVPWLFDHPTTALVATTYASLAVFLVLYHHAWLRSRARLPAYTVAIAVLGLAILFVNSAWSYVIYAGSLIPFCVRGWRAALWTALLLVAFYVAAIASGFFTPLLTVSCIVTTSIVALLNGAYRMNTERDAELRLTQDEVRRLAITAERERIGRDLHDLLGHTLSIVAIKSELARRLVAHDRAGAERELGDIERVARQALAEVREAVTGIRAAALAGELASARLMLAAADVAVTIEGEQTPLPPDVEAAFALGLREAVTNVERHARATRVDVRLAVRDGSAVLTIDDNGRGGVAARGTGLAGMQERIVALGGDVDVASARGRGTRIALRVPLAASHGRASRVDAADDAADDATASRPATARRTLVGSGGRPA